MYAYVYPRVSILSELQDTGGLGVRGAVSTGGLGVRGAVGTGGHLKPRLVAWAEDTWSSRMMPYTGMMSAGGGGGGEEG